MYNPLNKALLSSVFILLIPSICVAVTPGDLGFLAPLLTLMKIMFIALTVWLITIYVFFLLSLSKLLESCGEHTTMSSNLVWLNLVPVFNFGWMIYTVIKVSESIGRRFEANGSQDLGKGANMSGLVYSISFAIAPFIPIVIPVCLIAWMVYWLKIKRYNKEMSVF